MIYYITPNDILATLPKSFDAETCNVIRVTTDSEPTVNCQCEITTDTDMASVTTYFVTIELAQFTEDFEVSIADNDETLTTTVHVPVFDYSRLAWWLELQQLGYLVPILKKLGWTKLKQAAVIARQLSTMQGTEFALRTMLKLLDAEDTVDIKRKWQSGNDIAIDALHSTHLAKRGFTPLGTAIAQYHVNKLDTWKKQVYAKASQLLLTMTEISTCLRNVLPATIRLTDWQTVQVALACIYANTNVMHTECKSSTVYVNNSIDMQLTSKFVHLNVVRDQVSKQLIRYAEDTEHAYSDYVALLTCTASLPVQNATMYIDDNEFARCIYFDKSTTFVVQASDAILPGKHTVSIVATSDTGTAYSQVFDVNIEYSSENIDICKFVDSTATSELLHGHGLVHLATAYTESLVNATVKSALYAPHAYVRFFIPSINVDAVSDNDNNAPFYLHIYHGKSIRTIPLNIVQLLSLEDFDIEFKTVNDEDCILLTTLDYCGMYDITMRISSTITANTTDTIVKQQSIYISDVVRPHITLNTVNGLIAKFNAKSFCNVTINGVAIGEPVMHANDYASTTNILAKLSEMHLVVNKDVDNEHVCSIATDEDTMTIVADTVPLSARTISMHVQLKYIKRKQSFALQATTALQTCIPYAMYSKGCTFELFITENDKDYRLKCSTDSIVFTLVKSGNYKLTIQSTYYNKTILIQV